MGICNNTQGAAETPPAISVVIPTYGHRDFVRQAIESVRRQDFTDLEIIVINDGSPDDTDDLLRPRAEEGEFRYLRQENHGYSAAINRGITLARGRYIAFLDDDDLFAADKLSWQYDFLERNPEFGMVSGNAIIIDKDGNDLARTNFSGELKFDDFFNGGFLVSRGQGLYRRSVWDLVGGMNMSIWGADDWDLYFRIARVSRVLMDPRPALLYRKHGNNSSAARDRMLLNSCKVVKRHIAAAAPLRRAELARKAYCFIYDYCGEATVRRMVDALWAGNRMETKRHAHAISKLARPCLKDPHLAFRLLRSLVGAVVSKARRLD